MKRKSLAVIIACVAAVSGTPAHATDTTHHREYRDYVWADFSSTDTSSCALGIFTTVFVEAEQGVRYESGDTTAWSTVSIVVRTIDWCLDTMVFVRGAGPAGELQVDPNLQTAGLRTSLQGLDDSGNPVPITVDLAWSGVGRKDTRSEHFSSDFGDFTRITNVTDTSRYAIATGSVTVGTLEVTPIPSFDAWIGTRSERSNDLHR